MLEYSECSKLNFEYLIKRCSHNHIDALNMIYLCKKKEHRDVTKCQNKPINERWNNIYIKKEIMNMMKQNNTIKINIMGQILI
jgi:hypothetical protein